MATDAMMTDAVTKPDKDFSKQVDALLQEVQGQDVDEPQIAIDKLLSLEKQTRQASDLTSTSRLITAILDICKRRGDWSLLDEQVLLLSKKHGQLRQAITRMVQYVMTMLEETPNLETKLKVIETLRTVTEGKIFVEVERARVTRILSNIRKEQGDIAAAAEILCELPIETFGSMSRREKTEFILDQVSLCIERDDWTQAAIISRKISTRYFSRKPAVATETLQGSVPADAVSSTKASDGVTNQQKADLKDDVSDLKLRYYQQQIHLANHQGKYLDACKHWREILDTEVVVNDADKLKTALQMVIYYVILAPYDNEQSDLLQRISRDPRNVQVPVEAQLLKLFTVPELMRWPVVQEQYQAHLCSGDVFAAESGAAAGSPTAQSNTRWQDLHKRVVEHNIRVIAKCYARIQFRRITELLNLSEEETETYLSDLVTAKTIFAKIDRPARIVSFKMAVDPDDVLNEWSGKMKTLLGLLERVDHLIVKEEMIARILPGYTASVA